MIEEVVNSILDAEDEAKRKIALSEQMAEKAVEAAEKLAESKLAKAAEQNKARWTEALADAELQSSQRAASELAALNAQTDDEIKLYGANLSSAVDAVMEKLL
ncbi:MAG: hypothetical protein NC350_05140 [Corallococcus sp.]|nr:hypothetical protein [Corallococcus sp.]